MISSEITRKSRNKRKNLNSLQKILKANRHHQNRRSKVLNNLSSVLNLGSQFRKRNLNRKRKRSKDLNLPLLANNRNKMKLNSKNFRKKLSLWTSIFRRTTILDYSLMRLCPKWTKKLSSKWNLTTSHLSSESRTLGGFCPKFYSNRDHNTRWAAML